MIDLPGKRILYVITKSNWGGAQAYVYTLACTARDAGADVAVALGGTGAPGAPLGLLATRLAEAGIRTIPIHAFARDLSLFREWAALSELFGIIRRERPDVIHLNSSKAGGIGALAARIAGVRKIIFTAHGWDHRSRSSLLVRGAVRFASWLTVALATQVIAVSKLDKEDAPALFMQDKVVVVRNGVRPAPFLDKDAARHALGLPPEALTLPFWFLCLAELHHNKGQDVLIRAFNDLKTPDAALILIGEGEEKERYQALSHTLGLANRVFFTGFIADASRYLRAADVFVLPSRKEGLPLTLLEAGYAMLPVVAAATGGIPEVITDTETGLLFPPGASPALTHALAAAYDDSALRARLGASLLASVEKNFAEERMTRDTLALY